MDEVVILRMTTSFSSRDSIHSSKICIQNSEPLSNQNTELLADVLTDLQEELRRLELQEDYSAESNIKQDIRDLMKNLQDNNLQALMEAHDLIAGQNYPSIVTTESDSLDSPAIRGTNNGHHSLLYSTAIESSGLRKVGVRWKPGMELGMTVKLENGQLVVTRILVDSLIDKQGLLQVGDVITHVNDIVVSSLEQLQVAMKCPGDMVTFEILPNLIQHPPISPSYFKTYFSYDALSDATSPCPAIGMSFGKGEILQVVNMADENYWQARKLGSTGPARLIPSQSLQERKQVTCVQPGKRKISAGFGLPMLKRFCSRKTVEYTGGPRILENDKHEMVLYEEVVLVPPLPRKVIVLLGPDGAVRRALINKLLKNLPEKYGYPLPHTSRLPRPGEEHVRKYYFSTYREMHNDILANEYIEYGELNGILYGTRLSSVRAVIRDGRFAILDCGPQCLKFLRTKEFLPYVVFVRSTKSDVTSLATPNGSLRRAVAASNTFDNIRSMGVESNIQSQEEQMLNTYEPYIDLTIGETDVQSAYNVLLDNIAQSETSNQWIPVSWIY